VCRDAITKVGLLDEHIFYAPEDLDYCLRMWLNNYKVVYTTQAEVVHYTQRISHKNPKDVYCARKRIIILLLEI